MDVLVFLVAIIVIIMVGSVLLNFIANMIQGAVTIIYLVFRFPLVAIMVAVAVWLWWHGAHAEVLACLGKSITPAG